MRLQNTIENTLANFERKYGRTYLADERVVRTKLSGEASCLIRRRVRAVARGHCAMFGLKLDLQEERRLFSSEFNIVVEGPYTRVSELMKKLSRLEA